MVGALAHVLPEGAGERRGHLIIGGCDVVELADEFGTPLVVFDERQIRDRARRYRTALEQHAPGGTVIYASKAYSGLTALRLLHEEGVEVDVASGGELFAALQAGFPPERIHMHGNNKDAREIGEALDAGVGTIVIDGAQEIDLTSLRSTGATVLDPVRAEASALAYLDEVDAFGTVTVDGTTVTVTVTVTQPMLILPVPDRTVIVTQTATALDEETP